MSVVRDEEILDCAVIGGGPGGLVSALYLKRFKRAVVLISEGPPRASWIPRIRNLIGCRERTSGLQLVEDLKKQLKGYKVPIIEKRAEVKRKGKLFEINVGDALFLAKTVVLATGMKDLQPRSIKNLKRLTAAGVIAYCPICDGFDHRDESIVLLVGEPKGFKKIKGLMNFSSKMAVIYDGQKPLSQVWKKRLQEKQVDLYEGKLQSAVAQKKGLQIRVGSKTLTADVMYIELGSLVPTQAFQHIRSLKRNKAGFIETNSHQQTSVPGLYAVGDCVAALSQVSVAVGHAAIAATDIHHYLEN